MKETDTNLESDTEARPGQVAGKLCGGEGELGPSTRLLVVPTPAFAILPEWRAAYGSGSVSSVGPSFRCHFCSSVTTASSFS